MISISMDNSRFFSFFCRKNKKGLWHNRSDVTMIRFIIVDIHECNEMPIKEFHWQCHVCTRTISWKDEVREKRKKKYMMMTPVIHVIIWVGRILKNRTKPQNRWDNDSLNMCMHGYNKCIPARTFLKSQAIRRREKDFIAFCLMFVWALSHSLSVCVENTLITSSTSQNNTTKVKVISCNITQHTVTHCPCIVLSLSCCAWYIVMLWGFSHFSHYILIISELYESYYVQYFTHIHERVHTCEVELETHQNKNERKTTRRTHSCIRMTLLLSMCVCVFRMHFNININIKRSKWHKIGNAVDSFKLTLILIISKHKYTSHDSHFEDVHTAHSTWHICTFRTHIARHVTMISHYGLFSGLENWRKKKRKNRKWGVLLSLRTQCKRPRFAMIFDSFLCRLVTAVVLIPTKK